MNKLKDLEKQLNNKKATINEGKVGKELAGNMLKHVGGAGEGWVKATWSRRI